MNKHIGSNFDDFMSKEIMDDYDAGYADGVRNEQQVEIGDDLDAGKKFIHRENNETLRLLHDDEAIYVHAYYNVDKDRKRVYDTDMMREEFEENMKILIELNKQKGLA